MITQARSEPGIPVGVEELDANPWLLNVENGTLDLQIVEFRNHDKDDLLTKMVPIQYDAAATCPQFDAFLDQIMLGNTDLINYLWRIMGYSLTG